MLDLRSNGPLTILTILLTILDFVGAQDSDDGSFDHNPVLAHQPTFACSLPVQILVTGIKFALTGVLLCHLIFTAQYHWPLARLNYALQISGVVVLFISLIASIRIIFSRTMADSQQWPYMLYYLAVDMPPTKNSPDDAKPWSIPLQVGWYAMSALTSALVQLTHIQFLTLLYPSDLEGHLVLSLLGPLAVISAAMEFLPLQNSQKVLDIADTVRNTCNAALSLLFTAALMLWGFHVNRERAWRTDGGTAAFGAGAITLAIISVALNFLYIPYKDDYTWLPRLIWAVMQWQNFLGWWWWVGGEMGVSEVEELIRREERRAQKRRIRAAQRAGGRRKAQALWRNASETLRFARSSAPKEKAPQNEHIELVNRRPTAEGQAPSVQSNQDSAATPTASTVTGVIARQFFSTPVGRTLRSWFTVLRRAHLRAQHVQAIEHDERRQQVYRNDNAGDTGDGVVGWGLGSFGIRERERHEALDIEQEDRGDLIERENSISDSTQPQQRTNIRAVPSAPPVTPRWSVWWWGPLRRWRLQDTTSY
ncbi:hypothetical protein SCHPADRAFT_850404 [Schizopora paradoxa]|uniref:PalH-domain-containing protein n=1 Tax=Schizopora paradoxa TaxID=27342 RepID=A0A0H2RZL5_9AGAM|nr:hypothetical protein SCHPADRAFT_850404 [Schizopora paradoxa]